MSQSKKTVLVTVLGVLLVGCGQSNNPVPSDKHAAAAPSVSAVPVPVPTEPSLPNLQPLAAQDIRATRMPSLESCNVEAIGSNVFNKDPITLTEKSTTVGGWFLSSASKKSGVPAHLQLINEAGTAGWQMPIHASLARPDVVSSMGGVDSGNVGFSQAIDLSPLPAGRYRFVVAFEDAGQSYSCEKGRMIVIQ